MFDLEKSIANWRREMKSAGIKTPTTLDELEIHLREEIESQTTSGLSPQKAFENALQIMGLPRAVRDEFNKLEETQAAREWKHKQAMLLAITGSVSLLTSVMLLLRLGGFSDATHGQQIAGWAAVAAFNLFIWGGRRTWRTLPVISSRRIRETISISGALPLTLWWIVFAWIILPRTDFMMGQLAVALLWGFFPPTGIWIGLFRGLDAAARQKTATD
jgi:hypothetical protein